MINAEVFYYNFEIYATELWAMTETQFLEWLNTECDRERLNAIPVMHGEWLETDACPHRIYCSKCYKTYVPNKEWVAWKENMIPRNFCPNCGAKMDGKEKDNAVN